MGHHAALLPLCCAPKPHLKARACLSFMEEGECSMVKRASDVTNVLRSISASSSEVSHTELHQGGGCEGLEV